MEQRNTDSNRDVLFSSTEDSQQKAHITFTHTIFHAQLSHTYTYIHSYIHTYVRTYVRTYVCTYRHTHVRTYVHTYIYIRTYVHAYYLFTYFHTQFFTTSFVFPSFSDPATTFETHYWKKLTCGVIRSFNFICFIFSHLFDVCFDLFVSVLNMYFQHCFFWFVLFQQFSNTMFLAVLMG